MGIILTAGLITLTAGLALFVSSRPKAAVSGKETARQRQPDRAEEDIMTPEAGKKNSGEAERKIASITVDGLDHPLVIAAGFRHGLGRGEQWSLALSGPHISRRPHAWLSLKTTQLEVSREESANSLISINGAVLKKGVLHAGDILGLSDKTHIRVNRIDPAIGAFFKVVAGPDLGMQFILLTNALDIGKDIGEIPVRCGTLFWQNGRPMLRVNEDENRPLATMPAGRDKVSLNDGDVLQVGGIQLTLHLKEEPSTC